MGTRQIGFGLLGGGAAIAAAGGLITYMASSTAAAASKDKALENKMPENKMPENKMPENKMPENKMPENKMPENKMPENKMPENKMSTLTPKLTTPASDEYQGYPFKYAIFDTKTRYVNEKSNIYIPLHRLYTFLQFEDERVMFREAIKHLDNLDGLDALFRNNNAEKVTMIPVAAHSAKNQVGNILRAIVAYSEANRPSRLKLADMNGIVDEIVDAMNNILYNLDMTLSSMPMDRITGNRQS
jgi:hypothetical protein